MGAALIVLQDPQRHRAQQITPGTGVESIALQEVKNANTWEKLLESSLTVIDYTGEAFLCIGTNIQLAAVYRSLEIISLKRRVRPQYMVGKSNLDKSAVSVCPKYSFILKFLSAHFREVMLPFLYYGCKQDHAR